MKQINTLRTAIAAALVVTAGVSVWASQARTAQPTVGQPVPAFTMTTSAGKEVTSQSLRGKVVLLDFWATWCGPCKVSSPVMQEFHTKYGKKGLVVVGANTWERTNKRTAADAYAKEHNYTYMMTVENDKLAEAWGIRGVPSFYLIDQRGVVRMIQVGFDQNAKTKMAAEIERLLN